MKIKRVFLDNIRSYREAEINFPEGRVLLSGDIGSGKSSVLLAIEFALFGLQKGSLSGSSLLRNGADNGKVVVNFDIDNKEITIERNLKRGSKGVSQESGSITIGNERKEVAPKEIRSNVLQLLNYPPEFIEKKPELYRYTVYTPQEEMKQILVENAETRLNTLRRVFAIDKYKRISENINLVLARFRESTKNKEGMISDLDAKKETIIQKKEEGKKIEQSLKEIMPLLESAIANVNERKKELKDVENKMKEIEAFRRNISAIVAVVNSKTSQLESSKKSLAELEKEMKNAAGKKGEDIKALLKKISEGITAKSSSIKKCNQEILEINRKKSSIETKNESLEKLRKNIMNLDNCCPTCNQKITADYKKQFVEKINTESKSIEQELKTSIGRIEEMSKIIEKGEKELKMLIEQEKQYTKLGLSIAEIERKKADVEILEREIKMNRGKYMEMKDKMNDFKDVESNFEIKKKNVDEASEQKQQIEIKKARVSEQLQSYSSLISELEKEIEKKEGIKLVIEKYSKIKDWLNEQFIPLMALIEKNVLSKLHYEFNMFFEKWFNMLVASEGLNSRLDENFTPIIEQNGYELDYSFLSGGERTAAALAYRLSLNQVINSMLSHIKTRDLLILDEPTDGFSSEQLDKMKDVLGEINAKQIILVSHESKIENFVDNIVRFEKEGHVSRIA